MSGWNRKPKDGKSDCARKKNLRRISIVVTAQTLYHLNEIAAMCGWGEKDLGKVIDKMMREHQSRIEKTEWR